MTPHFDLMIAAVAAHREIISMAMVRNGKPCMVGALFLAVAPQDSFFSDGLGEHKVRDFFGIGSESLRAFITYNDGFARMLSVFGGTLRDEMLDLLAELRDRWPDAIPSPYVADVYLQTLILQRLAVREQQYLAASRAALTLAQSEMKIGGIDFSTAPCDEVAFQKVKKAFANIKNTVKDDINTAFVIPSSLLVHVPATPNANGRVYMTLLKPRIVTDMADKLAIDDLIESTKLVEVEF